MILFMAPTKPLVAQQIRACFDIIGFTRDDICDLTGSIVPAKRAPLYRSKRVVFASPQVIQNDLGTGLCPVERIVCVVIDEAHRATGDHAYVSVIKQIHKVKRQCVYCVSFRFGASFVSFVGCA
jgi:ATP-dependent DNA helicase MPH1